MLIYRALILTIFSLFSLCLSPAFAQASEDGICRITDWNDVLIGKLFIVPNESGRVLFQKAQDFKEGKITLNFNDWVQSFLPIDPTDQRKIFDLDKFSSTVKTQVGNGLIFTQETKTKNQTLGFELHYTSNSIEIQRNRTVLAQNEFLVVNWSGEGCEAIANYLTLVDQVMSKSSDSITRNLRFGGLFAQISNSESLFGISLPGSDHPASLEKRPYDLWDIKHMFNWEIFGEKRTQTYFYEAR